MASAEKQEQTTIRVRTAGAQVLEGRRTDGCVGAGGGRTRCYLIEHGRRTAVDAGESPASEAAVSRLAGAVDRHLQRELVIRANGARPARAVGEYAGGGVGVGRLRRFRQQVQARAVTCGERQTHDGGFVVEHLERCGRCGTECTPFARRNAPRSSDNRRRRCGALSARFGEPRRGAQRPSRVVRDARLRPLTLDNGGRNSAVLLGGGCTGDCRAPAPLASGREALRDARAAGGNSSRADSLARLGHGLLPIDDADGAKAEPMSP